MLVKWLPLKAMDTANRVQSRDEPFARNVNTIEESINPTMGE